MPRLTASHEGIEGGARVALAEVGSREAAHEAVDAESAHGLVAETEAGPAGVQVAPHDEAPAGNDLAVFVDGTREGPRRAAGRASATK